MASSSDVQTISSASSKPYHVFINHRGPDTKNTLASFIYHSFSGSGVNVFFDKEEFVAGQAISLTIREAISSSSVQIAILSAKYAESHWCLEELRLMRHNTDSMIIPVFFDVRPGDVGHQLQNKKGKYAKAFEKLEEKRDGRKKRYELAIVEEWRQTLYEVSTSLRRLDLDDFGRDLGTLAVAVRNRVMHYLSMVWRKSVSGFLRLDTRSLSWVQETLSASSKPCDVFISHHGPDTRKELVSFIYHYISEKGVNVFINTEDFVARQGISRRIHEAISNSSVQIAILSPGYADNDWCLQELTLMQKTGANIIPVFYNISPGDIMQLHKNKGKYAKAFRKKRSRKRKRDESDEIEEWKKALYKVCDISGLLDSDQFMGDLGKLVHELYTRVMQKVRTIWKKSFDGLLGVDKAVEDLYQEINRKQSEKVKIVGIIGTPGSGKTTLAEEFYYRHRTSFDRSSLLLGVRKASKQIGLPTMQSQLLKDLTNDCSAISNVSEGKDILADRVRRLCGTKCLKFLVVIDDIDDHQQLESLLRVEDVLSSHSLVVVSSRNKAVLKLSGISLFYKIKPLRLNDAQELLCRIVFHQPQPIDEFKDLTRTALSKCGYFPEFLKTLGGKLFLYGNNVKQDWENEMQMMISEILKAICGDLEEEEKQIFLDIVCFFEKMDKNSAIRVWDASEWRGARVLQKLEYMCLVQVDDATNSISVSDYLFDLGREVAVEYLLKVPDLSCHTCRPNVARNFLKGPPVQGSPRIRGTREANQRKLSEMKVDEVLKMELLDLSGQISLANFSDGLRNLVWLRWKECSETPIFPTEINNLRVLELLKGKFETLGQLPVQLREIIVTECLKLAKIPRTVGLLIHLEKLTFDSAICLGSLPPEFCKLQSLKHLVLRQCECLKSLPVRFGNLTNLQHIDLSYCRQLSSLPQSFGMLTRLKTLDLSNCGNLIIQADIFEHIRSIEELTMENCRKLKMLPEQMTLQGSLRKLNLFGTTIEELPGDINELTRLQELKIGSSFLKSLPPSLVNMPSLMELDLLNCTQLTSYSRSYGDLHLLDYPQSKAEGANTVMRSSYVYRRS